MSKVWVSGESSVALPSAALMPPSAAPGVRPRRDGASRRWRRPRRGAWPRWRRASLRTGADDDHIVTDQGALRRSRDAASRVRRRLCEQAAGPQERAAPREVSRRITTPSLAVAAADTLRCRGGQGHIRRLRRLRRALPAADRASPRPSCCRSRPPCWRCSSRRRIPSRRARRAGHRRPRHGPADPAARHRRRRPRGGGAGARRAGVDARARRCRRASSSCRPSPGRSSWCCSRSPRCRALVILLGASVGSSAARRRRLRGAARLRRRQRRAHVLALPVLLLEGPRYGGGDPPLGRARAGRVAATSWRCWRSSA